MLYLDLPDRERCYLLYLYGKDEAEDLTTEDKKIFKGLVAEIKGEAR